jgi:DNA-binding IclR family transcriptional regulator
VSASPSEPSRPGPAQSESKPARLAGSQTLARGLTALQLVATAPDGLTAQQVADQLDVHRTIAYRVLSTLAEFRFVTRGADGRYRPGAGLAALGQGAYAGLRSVAVPVMRELADDLGCTVSLLVPEGQDAVAVAVIEPTTARYHIAFREGSRHPLQRGAAGLVLLAAGPPRPGEPEGAALARGRGYAITHGQVEPGAWGLAVPIRRPDTDVPACLNLITHREDLVETSLGPVRHAAERIAAALA